MCCNADTKIGCYSDSNNNDIAKIGTYCCKCDKLCYYYQGKHVYYTDGSSITDIKLSTKLVRKIKLYKINKN